MGPASPVQLEVWGRHCSCSIPASPVMKGSSGISIASPTNWLLALSGPRLQLALPGQRQLACPGLCQVALARWQPGKRLNPLHLRDPPPQFGKGMIKIKSYVVIAFSYRKANKLRKWSEILHYCYGNKGLCHGCRSH